MALLNISRTPAKDVEKLMAPISKVQHALQKGFPSEIVVVSSQLQLRLQWLGKKVQYVGILSSKETWSVNTSSRREEHLLVCFWTVDIGNKETQNSIWQLECSHVHTTLSKHWCEKLNWFLQEMVRQKQGHNKSWDKPYHILWCVMRIMIHHRLSLCSINPQPDMLHDAPSKWQDVSHA